MRYFLACQLWDLEMVTIYTHRLLSENNTVLVLNLPPCFKVLWDVAKKHLLILLSSVTSFSLSFTYYLWLSGILNQKLAMKSYSIIFTLIHGGPLRTFPTLFIPLDSREIHVWFDLQKSWAFIYTQGQPRCLFHRACRINGDQRCSETREHLDQRRLEDTCLSDSAKTHAVLSLWQTCPYHSYAVRVKHSVPHSPSWVFLHAASHAAGLFLGHSFVFPISQGFTFIKKKINEIPAFIS